MFSALKQGNTVYVLDKRYTPTLKEGVVVAVSSPRPRAVYGNPLDTVVDITVKVDGVQEEFKNLPAGLAKVADGMIVIAETKEAMCTEVESLLSLSRQTLSSIPYHEKVMGSCEEMLKELSPQYAKEKEQEAKIISLENKMGGIESSIKDMKEMLAQALGKTTN